MATAMTRLELDMVTALEEMLELTEDTEPALDGSGRWGHWRGVRALAGIAVAHANGWACGLGAWCDVPVCSDQPARPAARAEVGA